MSILGKLAAQLRSFPSLAAAYLDARLADLEDGTTGLQLASTAPANVRRAAAAIGNGTKAARDNHEHDIEVGSAVGLSSATANGQGGAAELALRDHTHQISDLNGVSAQATTDQSAGNLANAAFALTQTMVLDIPAGATGDVDFANAPFAFRVVDVFAQKVVTSPDAGDTGELQNGAGTPISSVLALNIAADTLARTTSIAAAVSSVAIFGTLRWRRTQSTNAACRVYVTVVRAP